MPRLNEILQERELTLYQLSEISGVRYSTLKSTKERNGQLSVKTIEQICIGLHIPMSRFFENAERCA